MKLKSLFTGVLLGGLIVYSILTTLNKSTNKSTAAIGTIDSIDAPQWQWPDSLDAVIAAKDCHKTVFENEEFRILEVTVSPGQLDPIHTQRKKHSLGCKYFPNCI